MSLPEPIPALWAVAQPPAATSHWSPNDLAARKADSTAGTPELEADPIADAYDRGVQEGFAQGVARAEEQLRPAHETLAALLRALERERLVFTQTLERNLNAMAITIAHHLFQAEVEIDPSRIHELVRRAIALVPTESRFELRCHPADVEVLSTGPSLVEADGRRLRIHWIADPTFERGSFILESPERLVDGRADVALRTLYERLGNV
ncbi:MAG: FliH/SctL family protein [Gemmatimonadota bacterium]